MASRRTSSKPGTLAGRNAVEHLLRELKHPLHREILALRKAILAADPRIQEEVKWNAPSFYTVEHFATFHLRAKVGVQLVLHLGAKARPDAKVRAAIADPTGLLTWKGPDRANVTFAGMAQVREAEAGLTRIIQKWITFVAA